MFNWLKRIFSGESNPASDNTAINHNRTPPRPSELKQTAAGNSSEILAGVEVKKSLETSPQTASSKSENPESVAASETTLLSSKDLYKNLFCWLYDCKMGDFLPMSPIGRVSLQNLDKRIASGRHAMDSSDQSLLPRKPSSLPFLIRLLNSSDASLGQISEAILQDPALTSQVLKTANSPFFRTDDRPVESVENAVFMMGNDGIRGLVSASLMNPLISARNAHEESFSKRVWEWGLCAASALDHHKSRGSGQKTSYFLLGLLPSLAYLLIYREMYAIYQSIRGKPELEVSVLMTAVHENYWEVCRQLIHYWGLPESYLKMLEEEHKLLEDCLVIAAWVLLKNNNALALNDKQITQMCHLEKTDIDILRASLDALLKRKEVSAMGS